VAKSNKIAKPYPQFPLTPHPSGRWCKKIRGKLHYFGKTSGDEQGTAALERFGREWPYLKDGRLPPLVDGAEDGYTVRLLVNDFLTFKKRRVDAGELSPRTFADYHQICGLLVKGLGPDRRVDDLKPADFESLRNQWSRVWGKVRLSNEINKAKIAFRFAFDQRYIDKPVFFGQSFDRPAAKTIRKARREAGPRLFTPGEVQQILTAADPQIRAMVLLGVNCGFGNSDCANLPKSALDLSARWVDYPRPKTEIARRCPLWPETVKALRDAITIRPAAKDPADADCVFLTPTGKRWVRMQPKRNEQRRAELTVNALSDAFAKLLKSLSINHRRSFYRLRHLFESVGGDAKDPIATDAIMGHLVPGVRSQYIEVVSDERLQAVVNVVHAWLWPEGATP